MEVQFITSVAVITPNPADSRRLYLDALRPGGDVLRRRRCRRIL
jgi:hypothetical protein